MPSQQGRLLLLVVVTFAVSTCVSLASRSIPATAASSLIDEMPVCEFSEVPEYRNGQTCDALDRGSSESACDPRLVRVAMTLDLRYLRGTVAAVHSVLKHASCPENIFFHFVALSNSDLSQSDGLEPVLRAIFPSLRFKVYGFDQRRVDHLISPSVRRALDSPLNYARNYLAEMLGPCIGRVIYLDSDVIVVDDIHKLWEVQLSGSSIIGAPEYCHADFAKYFTGEFWSDSGLSAVFKGKNPCYFNTGVMVMDLSRWRAGDYTSRMEGWMAVQKETKIYELGSLPPFLLVFGGNVTPIDRRWNQHGLGGDNVSGSCRSLHPGPVSLLHWSGKLKPWDRLDSGVPCLVDYLWRPYDLHKPTGGSRTTRHEMDRLHRLKKMF
ncbi:hypothetical protein SAY87_005223 [Trapa incisa]|uniref:Hexosyltransferase n=1 Tax=Trapa incisa TaxID=236973 RepID=A0AAN7KC14_9MYRT|nr:hypothetical protein SAY87_005223 [Trapa incisa]